MKEDKGISCTILSIVYVVLAYISPLVSLRLIGVDAEKISSMAFCALVLPFLAGIVNAVYIRINRQKISRVTLLRCAIIIKYLMIPMYIIGGLLIVVFILLTCTPVVIMIFVGPFMIAVLSAYGYLTMLGGNAFSFAYIRKAREEGVHGNINSGSFFKGKKIYCGHNSGDCDIAYGDDRNNCVAGSEDDRSIIMKNTIIKCSATSNVTLL